MILRLALAKTVKQCYQSGGLEAAESSMEALRNVGPKLAVWLRQVGIHTKSDLLAVGVVRAFLRVRQLGVRPSLNLLWALQGAAEELDWRKIPEREKVRLLAELETEEA